MKRAPLPAAQPANAATHTFIIRIWEDHDGVQAARPVWRGIIEQVGSDQHVYFFDSESITHFIREQTGLPIHRRQGLLRKLLKWMDHAE